MSWHVLLMLVVIAGLGVGLAFALLRLRKLRRVIEDIERSFPIQDLGTIDVTAVQKDGGLIMAIVASRPVDDSEDTLRMLRAKIDYYRDVLHAEEFRKDFGEVPPGLVTFELACPVFPGEAVIKEITRRLPELREHGVGQFNIKVMGEGGGVTTLVAGA